MTGRRGGEPQEGKQELGLALLTEHGPWADLTAWKGGEIPSGGRDSGCWVSRGRIWRGQ